MSDRDTPPGTTIRGTSPEIVRCAIDENDPLPGTAGFAGRLGDGLVRDVLGRQPIFSEQDASTPTADESWAFDPVELDDPEPVPAGYRRTAEGDERVWTVPDPPAFGDRWEAIATLDAALDRALSSHGDGDESDDLDGVPVAFSGGLDSAIVASASGGPAYVTGFPESHDLEAARDAADRMGLDLRVVELSPARIEAAVPRVARVTRRTNAMDVGIALPLFLVAERVARDGFDRLALGQGADELFGGYAKVARARDDHRTAADTVRGAVRETIATLPAQLERDVLALRAAGVEPVVPLLHDAVVRAALRLRSDLLVSERGDRKVALRLAARGRLPDPVAFRDKKAVQYGSLVSRELDRLARQAGYKRRMDDHVGQYIRSLL